MDRSFAYTLQKVSFSSVTLKRKHMMCMKYIYERKDVFLWSPTGFGKSVTKHYRLCSMTSLAGMTALL